jgi:hypothetical protein
MGIEDILDAIAASDSECGELSSEDELDKLDNEVLEFDDVRGAGDELDYAVDTVGDAEGVGGDDYDDDDSAGNNDDDNDGDDVPLANRKKNNSKGYKFEKRRPFVPPQLPPFIPELETPAPDDQFPIEYVNMFLTDDMIENLVLESNKYATEKTGLCPNFTKAELRTYFGMYYMIGIVRLSKIDDYWGSDLRYGQIADKIDCVWKQQPWIQKLQGNFSIVSCDEFQSVDEIMVAFKGRSILQMYLPKNPKSGESSYGVVLHQMAFSTPLMFIKEKAQDYEVMKLMGVDWVAMFSFS